MEQDHEMKDYDECAEMVIPDACDMEITENEMKEYHDQADRVIPDSDDMKITEEPECTTDVETEYENLAEDNPDSPGKNNQRFVLITYKEKKTYPRKETLNDFIQHLLLTYVD